MPISPNPDTPWSLKRRLFRQWLFILVLLSIGTYLAASAIAQSVVQKSQDNLLQSIAQVILDSVIQRNQAVEFDLPYSAFDVLGYAAPEQTYYQVRVNNDVIAGYSDLPIPDTENNQSRVATTDLYLGDPVRFIQLSKPLNPTQSETVFVLLGQTRDSYQTTIGNIAILAASGTIIAFAVLAILGFTGVQATLKPLARIQKNLDSRTVEDFTPVTANAPSEINSLITTLNQTLEQHKRLLEQSRSFIAEATHQIKTPIAALSMESELLAKELSGPQRDRAHTLSVRARYTSKLIHQLLTQASLTYRSSEHIQQPTALPALIRSILRTLDTHAEQKGVGFNFVEPEAPSLIACDAIALREALVCLIENAIQFSPPLGDIEISIHQSPTQLDIHICDDGPGFGPDPERLKKAFVTTRDGHEGGGLGLAIAERVAVQHRGWLKLLNRPQGGGECVLSLPV
ncbi:MAG: sensor histidine kinase N-terminal domain-containing protein [Litorivicinaceae bacterium]